MSERAEFYVKGKQRRAEPYHYLASGLDNIFLLNGVSVEDTAYGPVVTIQNLNGLHRAIGLHIVERRRPITGPEFRFLRKQMELTQRELARLMAVSDQTVANYEKGTTKELGAADPLIRIHYLLHIVPDETRAAIVRLLADSAGEQREKLPELTRRKIVEQWYEGERQAA